MILRVDPSKTTKTRTEKDAKQNFLRFSAREDEKRVEEIVPRIRAKPSVFSPPKTGKRKTARAAPTPAPLRSEKYIFPEQPGFSDRNNATHDPEHKKGMARDK